MHDLARFFRVSALASVLAVGCGGGLARAVASGGSGGVAAVDAGRDTGAGGGSSFTWPPPIDPNAFGTFDLSRVTLTAFSQTGVSQSDPQVLALKPDLVPRAWGQWNVDGLKASDYGFGYPKACQTNGTIFVGGLTASVIFKDEMTSERFDDAVGRDASGAPVPHGEIVAGAFRAALASPGFRQLLIDIAKIQIDGGVDGLFFDEVNSSYIGANYTGNEGFDDHDVADFGRFLCAKHHGDASAFAGFGLAPSDGLDCASPDPGAAFDYRAYLARHGAQTAPLGAANPLSSEWGTTVQNRPDPAKGTFVETFPSLVYWQQIAVAVRTYARQKYGREILITANGIFPFVDFQSVGLYDWNKDGAGPRGFDYVPVTGAPPHLNGTVSFMPVLQTLADRSKRITLAAGGHEVPLLLFLDWPTDSMNRYYALPLQERKDYVRMVTAEASAFGMWFALPLATTTDTNTAEKLGMLDFFQTLRAFYGTHTDLFRGARLSTNTADVSATTVASRLVMLPDGRAVLHLVNHAYAQGFTAQTLSVQIPFPAAPASVTLVSPDLSQDQPAQFGYAGGKVSLSVPALQASMLVVVR